MSRAIQFRRGTAAENDNFTGLVGEITVDTTNKTIRVHDGETPGGTPMVKDITEVDYIVETQLPTAENNYTWYRKYKSGWVEQGGASVGTSSTVYTAIFPVEMADTNYTALAMSQMKHSGTGGYSIGIDSKTTTGFSFRGPTAGVNTSNVPDWMVAGLAAC